MAKTEKAEEVEVTETHDSDALKLLKRIATAVESLAAHANRHAAKSPALEETNSASE